MKETLSKISMMPKVLSNSTNHGEHFVLIPSLVITSSTVPMWNDWDTLTIIGNIYDNLELLEAS
jgi:hypothetical protein